MPEFVKPTVELTKMIQSIISSEFGEDAEDSLYDNPVVGLFRVDEPEKE